MTNINLLIEKMEALEQRVEELENQLAGINRANTGAAVVHPMEAQRESISRASLADQSKHMQKLKAQLRLKSDS